MSRNRRDNLRGYAEPVLRGRPLFIRLCEAFVDNLSLILRVALVIGAISFVETYLDHRHDDTMTAEDVPEQVAADDLLSPAETEQEEETWFTKGVEHAWKCTHTEYRNEHYDECVKEPSEVYKRPGADPDDTSFIPDDERVLYANLVLTADSDPSDP